MLLFFFTGSFEYLQHIHKNYRPSKPVISELPTRNATVAITAIYANFTTPDKLLFTKRNLENF